MVYTEIKERNRKKYFYRVMSIRKGLKTSKKRIYLGVDLPEEKLSAQEIKADEIFSHEIKKRAEKNIEKIKPKIIKILKHYKIKRAGIFGSYATGEQKKNSDIDILIKPARHMGLEFVGLQLELQDKLKKKVDLITYKSIYPLLKERILNEEVKIL